MVRVPININKKTSGKGTTTSFFVATNFNFLVGWLGSNTMQECQGSLETKIGKLGRPVKAR